MQQRLWDDTAVQAVPPETRLPDGDVNMPAEHPPTPAEDVAMCTADMEEPAGDAGMCCEDA